MKDVILVTMGRNVVFTALALGLLIPSSSVDGAVIPAERLPYSGNWSSHVGVPGGIPNRTTIYTTLNPGATASQIQNAINNCPSNQVVYLNAGTYNLGGSQIRLIAKHHWTLRGAGMGQTILTGSGNTVIAIGSVPWLSQWPATHPITSGNAVGSTKITVSGGTSGINVGELMWIEQPNVSPVIAYGSGSQFNTDRMNNNAAVVNLRVMVLAINGNEITFDPPLPFRFDGNPVAVGYGGISGSKNFGIEDLTIVGSTSSGLKAMQLDGCYGAWIKNVEFRGFTKRGITPSWGARLEFRGCYIHEGAGGHDNGYSLECNNINNSLFEDNIWYKCQASHFLQGGCMANVISYNVVFHTYNQDSGLGWMAGGFVANHAPYPMYNLYEGNYVNSIQPDFYYGGSRYGTLLRNYLPATDVETDQHRQAVSIDSRQWDYSVIGNVLGIRTVPSSVYLAKPNVTLNYRQPGTLNWVYGVTNTDQYGYTANRIFRLGYPYIGQNNYSGSGNPPAPSSGALGQLDVAVKPGGSYATIIHGNWDAASQSVSWDPNISDRNIPSSLYHSGKPAWFGNLAWPPYDAANPPTSITNALARIPAGYRLLYNANPPSSGNQAPVVTVGATPLTGTAPLTVNFSSAGSFDPEGTALSYSWTFGDGGTSTAANPSRVYTNAGVYTARLTVSDGVNATLSAALTITATGPPTNRPPVAVAGATPPSGPAPLAVAFSSAGSLDPDGTPLLFSWVFGDGGTSSAANPNHTYTSNGTYIARLTVSDGTNSTQSTPITISVVTIGSGLVAAYGFEEGAGGSITDVSGFNNTGTLNGATWTAQGRYGQALNFNGSSGMVVINSSASLNLSSAMTLEAWVYPTASQSGWSSVLHRQPDTYYLHASSPAGAMMPAAGGIYSAVEFYCAAPSPIPLNAWTHLAATFDGSLIRFYVNGVQVSTQAASGAIQTGSNPLRIGGNTYNQFFQGRIDEVRIYNRALSAGEIFTDMNTPVSSVSLNPAPPPNLRVLSSN